MTYEEFCKKEYPESVELYKRKFTPNYYECGVEYYYHPLLLDTKERQYELKKVLIQNCTIFEDGLEYHLLDEKGLKYSVGSKEIYKKLKRVNEDVKYNKCIIDDGSYKYVNIDGRQYSIILRYWRTYDTGRVGFSIYVRCQDSPVEWEYYNRIGTGEPVLKINKVKKSVMDRDQYELFFKVPVRRFKEIVFGNPNIKLPRVQHQIELE